MLLKQRSGILSNFRLGAVNIGGQEGSKIYKVTGINGSPDAAESILKGRLFATGDYSGYEQGYLTTKAAMKYLNGERIPKTVILPTVVIDKKNAKKWTLSFEDQGVPDWDFVTKHGQVTW